MPLAQGLLINLIFILGVCMAMGIIFNTKSIVGKITAFTWLACIILYAGIYLH